MAWVYNLFILAVAFFVFTGFVYYVGTRFKLVGLMVLGASLMILMNIIIVKQIEILPGVVMAATTFGDLYYVSVIAIISEVWGRKEAYKFVYLGLLAQVILVLGTFFVVKFVPVPGDPMHEHLAALFTPYWRIVFASWIAFYLSGIFKAWLQTKLKSTKGIFGRRLWLRDNLSSKLSTLLDNAMFLLIGLTGILPFRVILSTYIIGVLQEFLFDYIDTWVVSMVVRKLKYAEAAGN